MHLRFDQTVGCTFFGQKKNKAVYEIDESCPFDRFHGGNVCKVTPDEIGIAWYTVRWGGADLSSQKMARGVLAPSTHRLPKEGMRRTDEVMLRVY